MQLLGITPSRQQLLGLLHHRFIILTPGKSPATGNEKSPGRHSTLLDQEQDALQTKQHSSCYFLQVLRFSLTTLYRPLELSDIILGGS